MRCPCGVTVVATCLTGDSVTASAAGATGPWGKAGVNGKRGDAIPCGNSKWSDGGGCDSAGMGGKAVTAGK